MNDHDLVQQLKRLRRRVEQLQAEFEHRRVDTALFAEMESLMDNGPASDDRCGELQKRIDALREDHLITAAGNHHQAVRGCMGLKILIDRTIDGI